MKSSNLFGAATVETSPGTHMHGFTGGQLMVTHLFFEEGAIGTRHSHPHEQMTVVLKGTIEFTLGEERKLLNAGDVVAIPGDAIHGVVALTSAEVLDVFTPLRTDLMEKLNLPSEYVLDSK
jgi:quercetin dioxygenase-like cupin family protein